MEAVTHLNGPGNISSAVTDIVSNFTVLLRNVTDMLDYCDYNLTDSKGMSNSTPSAGLTFNKAAITIFLITSYVIIFFVGIVGNSLVIYVVLRFAKMKTVTNLYILNLAISDASFLISLPFIITTTLLQHWIFGTAMCKIYNVLYSINFVTSVLTLTVLSGDRYLAVCHPIRSGKYRTLNIAYFICLIIWSLSFLVMLPIILYSTTVSNYKDPSLKTCTIQWPSNQLLPQGKAFTWYTFLLGFAIPVSMITMFYSSVIVRLTCVGQMIKSKGKRKSHRKVTKLVLAVILVYVCCWLPHWVFQINLTFLPIYQRLEDWEIYLFNVFTVLTFANSMLNPLLYAFLSDNFRRSFAKAFKCVAAIELDRKTTAGETCNSVYPKSSQKHGEKRNDRHKPKFELDTMKTSNTGFLLSPDENVNTSLLDTSSVYVDKESQTQQDDI
ncbi:somatostatin receptor type 2-like [Mytilus trossulus]|uniref:somatostatin receptor type 2-like n=1 Tax=Mytilus trossulus TaxID=6551 RepID=UPI0030079948